MSPYEVLISVSDQHISWGGGLFYLILPAWVLSTVVLPMATITVVVVSQWISFFLGFRMYCCSILKKFIPSPMFLSSEFLFNISRNSKMLISFYEAIVMWFVVRLVPALASRRSFRGSSYCPLSTVQPAPILFGVLPHFLMLQVQLNSTHL